MKLEWDKQVLAADLDYEYGEIQKHATWLALKEKTFQLAQQDYARQFRVTDNEETQKTDEARQQLARFCNKVYGYYEAHMLLRGTRCTWLRKLFGLPTGDFFDKKWAGRGQRHCLLVEPLDVANWYKLGKKEDYCIAKHEARPPRYELLQRKAKGVLGQRECNEITEDLKYRNRDHRIALNLEPFSETEATNVSSTNSYCICIRAA
eukprot:jgi/Chrzof1/8094/UNPLg00139.t1